jgi:hypothetical protein
MPPPSRTISGFYVIKALFVDKYKAQTDLQILMGSPSSLLSETPPYLKKDLCESVSFVESNYGENHLLFISLLLIYLLLFISLFKSTNIKRSHKIIRQKLNK